MARNGGRWIWVTLFVGAVLLAMWVCARWYLTAAEDGALARLEERGAEVIQSGRTIGGIAFFARSSDVTLIGGEVGSEEARLLQRVRNLKRFGLLNVRVRDDFVLPAGATRALRDLYVYSVQAGPGFWQQVSRLEKLTFLHVLDTSLDARAMQRIASVKSLMFLSIDRCPLPGDALEHLSGHQSLYTLGIGQCPITDEDLRRLKNLPTLEVLDLSWCRIRKPPWESFASFPKLRVLGLRGNPITDEALVGASAMAQLRKLNLSRTLVTDGGMRYLESIQADLSLPKTRVTWRAAEALRKRDPWRKIELRE